MKHFKIFLAIAIFLAFYSISQANDIPQLINFQGILDSSGNPLANRTVSVEFKIYDASVGGNILWSETQSVTTNAGGVFNVLLGFSTPIPDTAFQGTSRYLGIKITTEASEMTPRQRLVSMPYSYEFDDTGPDSIVSPSGSAFLGKAQGSGGFSSPPIIGIKGLAKNASTGEAYGGFFKADSGGTGINYGVYGEASTTSSYVVYGCYGKAKNISPSPTASAIGGFFQADSGATSSNTGIYAKGLGSSSTFSTSGVVATAYNSSPGPGGATGGKFTAYSAGGNEAVRAEAFGSSLYKAYGVFSYSQNTSTGDADGGYFQVGPGGTGAHYGVDVYAQGSSASNTYGYYSSAENSSTGQAYGGLFTVSPSGTGTHYGVFASEVAGGSGAAIYAGGDFAGSGAKYAVCKTTKGNRLMSVIEAPEVLFEDFGESKLFKGKAHVELDPLFLETVTINAQNPMKVFIQLEDDCQGVYVKKHNTGFEVYELQNGTSNASFSYRVIAKRKGYENQRLLQTTLGEDDPNLYPELWQKIEKEQQERKAQMELDRPKLPDETKPFEN